jgi:PTH2 family peptidyl-tRNA hydrolase
MTPGKIASQAGHAYVGAFTNCKDSHLIAEYHNEFPRSPGTKICLHGDLVQIYQAQFEAEQAGISNFLVVDSGCSNFYGGQPIVTALGLGPATKEQIQHITKKFKLL